MNCPICHNEIPSDAASCPALRASPFIVMFGLLAVFVLYRYGILAMVSAKFFYYVWVDYPLTTELTAWYASSFALALGVCVALALYGFYISLAGQPLFAGKLLED